MVKNHCFPFYLVTLFRLSSVLNDFFVFWDMGLESLESRFFGAQLHVGNRHCIHNGELAINTLYA